MARATDILAIARREIGTVEQPGNRQKYGKAYGMDGVYWCMPVSYTHLTLPTIYSV